MGEVVSFKARPAAGRLSSSSPASTSPQEMTQAVMLGSGSGRSWVERHRARYFNRRWLRSAKGNPYLRLASSDGHGAAVTIFRMADGWRWSVVRSAREGPVYARQAYMSAVEARQGAWDALAAQEEASA